MAKIHAPNKEYTGVSASIKFENGVGETDDQNLIGWFEETGYDVEAETPIKVQTKVFLSKKTTAIKTVEAEVK